MNKTPESLDRMQPRERPKRQYDLPPEASVGTGLAAASALLAVNAVVFIKNLLFDSKPAKAAEASDDKPVMPSQETVLEAPAISVKEAPVRSDGVIEFPLVNRLEDGQTVRQSGQVADNLVHLVRRQPIENVSPDNLHVAVLSNADRMDLSWTGDSAGHGHNDLAVPQDLAGKAPTGKGGSGGGGKSNRSRDDQAPQTPRQPTTSNGTNLLPLLLAPVGLGTLLAERSYLLSSDDLLKNAVDPDSDELAVENLAVSNGSLSQISAQSWNYQPPENFTGEVTLHYTISDGENAVDQFANGLVVPLDHAAVLGSGRIYHGTDADFRNATVTTIRGTDGDDILEGTDRADHILAGDGDDIIYGFAGNDVLEGGAGSDVIFAGAGNDQVFAGSDNDVVFGEQGDDWLKGEEGNDLLDGATGNDLLVGGEGDDVLLAGEGQDIAYGGSGDDTLIGGADDDILAAGAGDDLVIATTADGNDDIDGGAGIDGLDLSQTSADALVDLAAGVAKSAEIGDDTIENIEQVIAGLGDDTLIGSEDDNELFGGGGDDDLSGGDGADILSGGAGADDLSGDAGDDIVVAEVGDGNDAIDGGAGHDLLDLSQTAADALVDLAAGVAKSAEIGEDTIENVEYVDAGSGDDIIIFNDAVNIVSGGDGEDIFVFESITSLVNQSAGRDLIKDFAVGDKIDVSLINLEVDSSGEVEFEFLLDANTEVDGHHIKYRFELEDDGAFKTVIEGYLDADDETDFEIDISGQYNFSRQDFIGVNQEFSA